MSGWSNLSNELFRMSHNVNQTIWASGAGRRSFGIPLQSMEISDLRKKSKVKKNLKKNTPEKKQKRPVILENLAEESEKSETKQNFRNTVQQTAEMRKHSTETDLPVTEDFDESRFQVKSPEELQERVLWAEILGEPVSVKRRKKRMSQYYGY